MTDTVNLHRARRPRRRRPRRASSSAPRPISPGSSSAVRPIIEAVRLEGDVALARFAREFDKAEVDPDAIAATPREFDEAFGAARARRCATRWSSPPATSASSTRTRSPRRCGCTRSGPAPSPATASRPIPSVACYVPRGKGAFPSVAMMTTIPAVVAGVKEIVIVTPPGPGRRHRRRDAGRGAHGRRRQGLQGRRRAGRRRRRLRHRDRPAVRQGRRAGQPLGGRGQAAPGRRHRHRHAGRAERADRPGRRHRRRPARRARSPDRGRARPGQLRLSRHLEPTRRRGGAGGDPGLLGADGRAARRLLRRPCCAARAAASCSPRTIEAAIAFVNDYAPEHSRCCRRSRSPISAASSNAGEILLGEHTPMTLGNFVARAEPRAADEPAGPAPPRPSRCSTS